MVNRNLKQKNYHTLKEKVKQMDCHCLIFFPFKIMSKFTNNEKKSKQIPVSTESEAILNSSLLTMFLINS